ncbi:MAG: hypothetical protein CMD16_04285 [Flavobacteriales bacterium]|nr:hypothetical protein [Flavobacteriales bacterium]|tara:strand:- start:24493 stop:25650 length:1158 start_codon:yes stop_codon:yes gene_type:complete
MKKIIGFLSVLLISMPAFSQEKLNTITTSVPFLLIGPDARAGAMGDVGVATNPDVNSMHWNPAKFAFIENDLGVSISFVPWLRALVNDINLSYLTGYKKIGDNQAVGFELGYFSLGDITFTDITGNDIGQYDPKEYIIGSAYSRKLSRSFSLSVGGKYILSNLTGGQAAGTIPTVAGQSIAADLSAFYNQPMRISGKDIDLAIGCNISNIGSKVSYTETIADDFIPINLRLGLAVGGDIDPYNKISLAFDINKLLVPTPAEYDGQKRVAGMDPDVGVVEGMFQSFWDAPGGPKEEFREINYSTGMEYWYDDQFAVRSGYFSEHQTKGGRKYFTFGMGMKYTVYTIDFSYLINANNSAGATNPLANTMRFSLTWDFGGVKDVKQIK